MAVHPYIVSCEKCGMQTHRESSSRFVCASCRGIGYPRTFYKNRKIIFKRDEHKCQSCGDTKKIIAHHIDCNRLNNSPSNLITLCNQCHRSLHATYTKKQLREGNIYKMLPKEFIFEEFGKRPKYEHFNDQLDILPKTRKKPKYFRRVK